MCKEHAAEEKETEARATTALEALQQSLETAAIVEQYANFILFLIICSGVVQTILQQHQIPSGSLDAPLEALRTLYCKKPV